MMRSDPAAGPRRWIVFLIAIALFTVANAFVSNTNQQNQQQQQQQPQKQSAGELDRLLRRIRDERGVTIIMIEHVIRLVMGVCDTITVLSSGAKIAEGTGEQIISNPEVQRAYLGKAVDAGH